MTYEQFSSCIAACNQCANACDRCFNARFCEQHSPDMASRMRVHVDCAAICRTAAGAMARSSLVAHIICETCANVCDICAKESMKHDVEVWREADQACRECATACRQVAALAAALATTQAAN